MLSKHTFSPSFNCHAHFCVAHDLFSRFFAWLFVVFFFPLVCYMRLCVCEFNFHPKFAHISRYFCRYFDCVFMKLVHFIHSFPLICLIFFYFVPHSLTQMCLFFIFLTICCYWWFQLIPSNSEHTFFTNAWAWCCWFWDWALLCNFFFSPYAFLFYWLI